MREIIPTKDFIVMQLKHDVTSKIILPDEYDKMQMVSRFTIMKAGPQCKEIKVGDGVVVAPEAVVKFQFNGQDYFLSREENVGAVIREMDR